MKIAKFAAAAIAAASLATAAYAAEVTVGATVYGPEGNPVGTVESVADGVVTLDTGKHKAPLPTSAFGEGETGPTITVTKAQLDAMLDEQIAAANAQRDAALVAMAAVVSADGQAAGTIDSIEGDAIILARPGGKVSLLREHFAVDANGQLMVLYTVQQLDATIAAAANASAQPAE